jgi:hypothetical protein
VYMRVLVHSCVSVCLTATSKSSLFSPVSNPSRNLPSPQKEPTNESLAWQSLREVQALLRERDRKALEDKWKMRVTMTPWSDPDPLAPQSGSSSSSSHTLAPPPMVSRLADTSKTATECGEENGDASDGSRTSWYVSRTASGSKMTLVTSPMSSRHSKRRRDHVTPRVNSKYYT